MITDVPDPTLLDPAGEHPTARRLLDAAIAAIDEGGETAVRVQEIVADAGVAIPALYRHFGSREGLVQAAQADRLTRDLDQELDIIAEAFAAVEDAAGFRNLMDEVLTRSTTAARTDPRWRRVNVIGSTYGRPELAEHVAAIQGRAVRKMSGLLRGPLEAGWLRPGLDLDAACVWLAGQLISRIVQDLTALDPAGPVTDPVAYDRIWSDAVRHALFG